MKPKDKITKRLKEMGFENIELFYWAKDGWYMHCDEAKHFWVGINYKHVIRQLEKEFPTKYDVLRRLAGIPDYLFDENKNLRPLLTDGFA